MIEPSIRSKMLHMIMLFGKTVMPNVSVILFGNDTKGRVLLIWSKSHTDKALHGVQFIKKVKILRFLIATLNFITQRY